MAELLRIELAAELASALHILGPGRTAGLLDRPIELDAEGYPLIPASSLRGRLRVHLERLLHASGHQVCIPPSAERMCPHAWGDYCIACRIFGSSWYESDLIVGDLRLDARQRSYPALLRAERTSVSISRRLHTAQAERLFATETTARTLGREPLRFVGQLHARLEPFEAGFLLAAARLVTHAGGSKGRGLGALRLEATAVEWRRNGAWVAADAGTLVEEALSYAAL
jgi:CRISPR/Cas system CSM-associated protein Csm3 (group 7 of RAMP superfamily)